MAELTMQSGDQSWGPSRPKTLRQLLRWMPRALATIFAGFLSIFALDVFSEGNGFIETFGALLMHLIPAFLIVGALILAWRWKKLGGVAFLALGAAYILMGPGQGHLSWILIIAGPAFAIGVLFLLDGYLPQTV